MVWGFKHVKAMFTKDKRRVNPYRGLKQTPESTSVNM